MQLENAIQEAMAELDKKEDGLDKSKNVQGKVEAKKKKPERWLWINRRF